MTNDNVFGIVQGGKGEAEDQKFPVNVYAIMDQDHTEHLHSGFMIFTSQHLAVMRDDGHGAIPIFVIPLQNVKYAEVLEEEEEQEEMPF